MPSNRINAGTALVAVGALALLIGLFMDWYEPDLSAWTVFELVDLLLAALALAALALAVGLAGDRAVDPRWLLGIAIAAVILVVEALINDPPAVIDRSHDSGAWVSLAGAVAMLAGAVLATNRVSVVISFAPRPGERPADPDAETRRYPTNPD